MTIESGRIDGLAMPAVLLFASLTAPTMSAIDVNWYLFGAKLLILGPLAGQDNREENHYQ